jgi:monothiol glutaredoxin
MDIENKKKEIESLVKGTHTVLFMKGNKMAPQCGFSAHVVQILMNEGIEFETRDVLSDDSLRSAIKEYSDWPTLPQLYINGEFIGGCDIISELHASGELKTLLTK